MGLFQLGLVIPNFGAHARPNGQRRWLEAANELGLDIVMVSDHVAITADVARWYPAPFYDPLITLAWMADQTKAQIGISVLVAPYRHPLLTARMLATLADLAPGRLIVGMGTGWAASEFHALGLSFADRGLVTNEFVAAIRTLWAGDRSSFDGRWVRWSDIDTRPRPSPASVPPIWIGGNGTGAIRRAARFGDAWHPLEFTFESLPRDLARLADEARVTGRRSPDFAPRIRVRLNKRNDGSGARRPGDGSLGEVVDDIAALAKLGASAIVLDLDDPERRPSPPVEDQMANLRAVVRAVRSG